MSFFLLKFISLSYVFLFFAHMYQYVFIYICIYFFRLLSLEAGFRLAFLKPCGERVGKTSFPKGLLSSTWQVKRSLESGADFPLPPHFWGNIFVFYPIICELCSFPHCDSWQQTTPRLCDCSESCSACFFPLVLSPAPGWGSLSVGFWNSLSLGETELAISLFGW